MTNNASPAGEKIMEGNKIIAEFMGGKFLHDFNPTYVTFRPINFGGMTGDYSCQLNDCHFDSSWDWLMPVVEKIAKYFCNDFEVIIYPSSCHITSKKISFMGTGLMRDAVYDAVTQFITWYNQQTPSNGK